jgi:hypothetical protein
MLLQVRQQFPIRDLLVMRGEATSDTKLHLEFANFTDSIDISHPEAATIVTIAQSILFSYQAISFGRHPSEQPRIELPPSLLKDYLPPGMF